MCRGDYVIDIVASFFTYIRFHEKHCVQRKATLLAVMAIACWSDS